LVLGDFGVGDGYVLVEAFGDPVAVAGGEGDGHLLRGFAFGGLLFDCGVKVEEEVALAGEDLGAAGVPVAGEDVDGV
jgi:hypothetical protein